MLQFIYHCKKNGLDYVIESKTEITVAQDAYAWRRGVREYMDNYHASVTRKNWSGTDADFAAEISKYCDEALARFNTGDVPGERGVTDPKVAAARKSTAQLVAAGITELTPEMLAALAKMADKARKAA